MSAVADLGCLVCKGPAEIHHIGTHMGGGRDHSRVIPLCAGHHRTGGYRVALHHNKTAWQQIYGTEQELHDQVMRMLRK